MNKLWWFRVVRGHSRSTAMSPFDRAHTTSYSTLIETMCLSFTVFEIQPVICRKQPILTPHVHLVPLQGVTPVEFRGDLWLQKTRLPVLLCGVVCVILRLAVLVELRLVTDRQTDRHRAMTSTADAQHRAVKMHTVLITVCGQLYVLITVLIFTAKSNRLIYLNCI